MAQPEQARGNGNPPGANLPPVTPPTSQVPELFVDGYKNVTIHDLVLRMNLVAYYPNTADAAEMETHVVGRLVLSLPAFLGIYEGFTNLISDMEARGMISRRQGGSDD